MTKKYILTGGPGSGKSSTLLELEQRGEYIIREAAEDVIKLERKKGIERPWEMPDFQRKVLNLQIQRESTIPQSIERIFIDRGIPDGLAYTKPETPLYREIKRASPIYEGVFIIQNIGKVENNGIRHENQDDALELEYKLKEVYLAQGYKIPTIPPMPVSERADLILNIIDHGRR